MKRKIMFANGWGTVVGEDGQLHWVYIPLWDPIRFNEVGRALFTTMVIKQHIAAIDNVVVKEMLTSIVMEQAKIVAGGFIKAMEAGDGDWCGTPYPHHWSGGGGIDDPDGPVYREAFGDAFSKKIDAKAALTLLGNFLKNEYISKAAGLIELNNEYKSKIG